jgi:hypothetical protein
MRFFLLFHFKLEIFIGQTKMNTWRTWLRTLARFWTIAWLWTIASNLAWSRLLDLRWWLHCSFLWLLIDLRIHFSLKDMNHLLCICYHYMLIRTKYSPWCSLKTSYSRLLVKVFLVEVRLISFVVKKPWIINCTQNNFLTFVHFFLRYFDLARNNLEMFSVFNELSHWFRILFRKRRMRVVI